MKIWIIDDEEEICEILGYLLRRDGHEVRSFQDPRQAVAAITVDGPQTVICDFKMPHLNGLEVFQRFRQHWQGPFFILTGEASTSTEELLAQGIREVLFKPRDLARLPAILKTLS